MPREVGKMQETIETQETTEIEEKKKPQFAVKMNGNYVGSAWMANGKFGRYVSVVINNEVPSGSRVNIYPTRENADILG